MMTTEQKIEMFKKKKAFIDNISRAFELNESTVTAIEYEVYSKYNPEYATTYYAEFVVVSFTGGAISVAIANGNSDSANFRAIGKLIDGGYYDDINYYNAVKDTSTVVTL